MSKRRFSRLISLLTAAVMAAAVVLTSVASVSVEAAGTSAGITVSENMLYSALIQGDQVVVEGLISEISEDGIVHLYAQQPYESGTEGTEVAQAVSTGSVSNWTFALNYNTASSNLTKKFQAVIQQNGVMTAVGNAIYILNPEANASYTSARMETGKKGLLPAATLLDADYLTDLGVQQCTYNLTLGRIVSNTGGYGTISYDYNGKTYYFDYLYVSEYDIITQRLNEQGIEVTLIILNEISSSVTNTTLIHPMATIPNTTGTAENYYALNAATQDGVELLEAVMSFLAERYSGTTGHGQVDNWIIGNEVNAYTQWNYMSSPSLEYYAQEYANAFRVCYNAIKSKNANAGVYVGTDQQWAYCSNPDIYYSGRDFLDAFNSAIDAEGNIDWDLATHPYDVPLYATDNWSETGYAIHDEDSMYLTMYNIEVVTDYLCQEEFLNPAGEVRSVKLSEVGYSSLPGEDVQAAAITYAYLQAINNQYIDGLIITRELDDASEIVGSQMAVGLLGLDGTPKLAYDYYKNLGSLDYINAASAIAGVDLLTQSALYAR